MRVKRALVAAATAWGVTMAAACAGADAGSEAAAGKVDEGATLRAAWSVAPDSLDPHMQASEIVANRFGFFSIYDRLFTVTAAGEAEGMLVDDWGYSADGRTLDLSLREDVTFRDGTALDAAVVKVNLDRARTLESPVVMTKMEPVTAVEVTGPYDLALHLAEPTPVIPFVLAEMSGCIMHPDLIADGDPATEANGTGAYEVEKFTPGERAVLVRDRDDYWDEGAAKIARIEHTAIPDLQALGNALAGGQIDIGQFQPNQVANLEGRPGLKTVAIAQGNGVDLFFNPDVAPMDSLEVRQAVNVAIDRESIVDALYPGSQAKYQYYREGVPGYDPELDELYTYDPDRARDLLEQAGYPDGVDLGEIIVSTAVIPGVIDVIKEQLAAVGITFTITTLISTESHHRWAEGKNSAQLGSANSGTNPVAGAQENWYGSTRNPAGTTAEFDKIFKAAADNRLGPEEADAAAQDINRYVVVQAWRAPIVWINFQWVMTDRLQNFSPEMDFSTTQGPYDWSHLAMTGK